MQAAKVVLRQVDGGLEAGIQIDGARGLKALYFELRYDAQRWEATEASSCLRLGQADELLELARLDRPGLVTHGQVLRRWDRAAGFSGDGELAVVRFSNRRDTLPVRERQAALAPQADASRALLSLDLDAVALNWSYYSQGDYDQNSEVNISDLTPLGLHFGESGPFTLNSIGAVVDGDGNGEINIADLTPIGANFGRRVSGYRIFESTDAGDYPPSNDAPSTLEALSVTALHAGDPAQQRLHYSFALTEIPANAFYWVRPVDGDLLDPAASEGTPSNMVSVAAPGNQPPVAELAANPATGLAPLQLRLSAADSTDPDGEIVLYEWDFDGDGLYDLVSPESFCDHIIANAGESIIAVRVTDDLGAADTDDVNIVTILPDGWQLYVPFPPPSLDFEIGAISEPVLVQGNPAIAFEYRWEGLYYSRSIDQTGTLWTAPVALPTGGQYRDALTLAVVDGIPALAYPGIDNDNLYFMRASDALGEAWGGPQQIAAYAGVYGPQLLVSGNGRPLIGFLGTAGVGNHIEVALGMDAQGSAWNELLFVIESGAGGYTPPSLALVGGEPAAAYGNGARDTLFALSTGDPDGSAWDTQMAFDLPPLNPFVFAFPDLLEIAGRPAIALGFCGFGEPQRLRFVRADDAAGTGWTDFVFPDDGAEMWSSPSLFLLGGIPAIAYTVLIGGELRELRLVRATDAEASGWNAVEAIGEFAGVDEVFGLELADGRAALAFNVDADGPDPRLIRRALYFAVEN